MYRLDLVLYPKRISNHSHLHMFDIFETDSKWSPQYYTDFQLVVWLPLCGYLLFFLLRSPRPQLEKKTWRFFRWNTESASCRRFFGRRLTWLFAVGMLVFIVDRISHTIHGTNGIFIYMNRWFCMVNVGRFKYTSPMDVVGCCGFWLVSLVPFQKSKWRTSVRITSIYCCEWFASVPSKAVGKAV